MFSKIQYALAVLSNKVLEGTQIILCCHVRQTGLQNLYVHTVPLHWPYAGEHSKPCLRQVHLALAQSDEPLNLINCRSDSGAAGRSVIRGSTWPSVTFHP